MMKTILVPLDGSPLAERALPYATALARAVGGRLILARAAHEAVLAGTDRTGAQVAVIREAEGYLAGVAEGLTSAGLHVDAAVTYGGAVEGILLEADARRPDLIVMATHGRGGLGRWVYGSVAEAVLARAPVPVLLVRAWEPAAEGPFGAGTRLLVPLDGSAFAEAALPVAMTLAGLLGGEVTLLHAISPFEQSLLSEAEAWSYPEQIAEREAGAREYLGEVAERFGLDGRGVQADIRVGTAPDVIAAAAHERGAGLVVIATHGRTGLGRLLLGSTADATLRRGATPLLLVRPPALTTLAEGAATTATPAGAQPAPSPA